ncbi:MAG: hypothetical protein KF725_10425 [Cyclobacteriaceae bacterium]|nr:hypothetical protein [Cyclobacteriaceae bacterium]UYN86126.1 MAG: hypothetical protein KIT51_14820 [Cyclobacteriaceae bacterium]
MKLSKALVLFLFLLLCSCGNKIIYFGREYAETTHVDIYFRESDVKESNEIMGKLTYEVSARKRSDKVQQKIIERVKRKGADAIIFDDISLTTTGAATGGGVAGKGTRRGFFFGLFGSKTKYERGQQIKATLVKYRKNMGD